MSFPSGRKVPPVDQERVDELHRGLLDAYTLDLGEAIWGDVERKHAERLRRGVTLAALNRR